MLYDKENRMEFWYPKIPESIPKPKTEIIMINPEWTKDGSNMTISEGEFENIERKSEKFKFPLFMRGSETSGKHDWKETCFVKDKSEIRRKVIALIEDSMLKDIGCNSIVLREYIKMDTRFWAFHGRMPVNPERRYFIKNGEIICHHPYWIQDAIYRPVDSEDEPDLEWIEKLKEMNIESNEEIEYLTKYSEDIAKNFNGSWSIDFCKDIKGYWFCIDMALAEDSWHPKCPKKDKLKGRRVLIE